MKFNQWFLIKIFISKLLTFFAFANIFNNFIHSFNFIVIKITNKCKGSQSEIYIPIKEVLLQLEFKDILYKINMWMLLRSNNRECINREIRVRFLNQWM